MRLFLLIPLAILALAEPATPFHNAWKTRSSPMRNRHPSLMTKVTLDGHQSEAVFQAKIQPNHPVRTSDLKSCNKHGHKLLAATVIVLCGVLSSPSPSLASITNLPRPSEMQQSLISILDNLSNSGAKGMAIYTLAFILWTITVGVTTPVETAAGMAFPLVKCIPLSAIGKIGGAFLQYSLAKYIFRDIARDKMKDNEWMAKIDRSFQSHPFRVALIWRFSPLPEFVKNIGPSLVPTLKTRYQVLATLVHGLPFTVLWSIMGNEAADVARGKAASVFLKRMVAGISWIGLFVSPTLFGWWIKGLGDDSDVGNVA